MIEKNEITAIGKFLKTHALKGELNAVFDLDTDLIDTELPLIIDIDGIYVPFYIDGIRPKGQFASLVKLDGIDSEAEAKPFVNKTIYLLKRDLPEDDADEEGGYADDFIGYTIVDTEAGAVGEIVNVDLSTQNTLFIVRTADETEVFIPVNEEFIVSINPDTREITTSLPEGLIDLNAKKPS